MNFDSLIFDLDGTLWNSSDTVAEAWNVALEKAGYDVRITGADVLKQMGKLSAEELQQFLSTGYGIFDLL